MFDKSQLPDPMSLRFASIYSDISEQRLRTLVREGKIASTKTEKGVDQVTKEALDTYSATKHTGGTGGARKVTAGSWVIRVPNEKLDQVQDALGALGIELAQRYDYAKQKAYRTKKALEKIAAAKEAAPSKK
jgi:hypothetical protein